MFNLHWVRDVIMVAPYERKEDVCLKKAWLFVANDEKGQIRQSVFTTYEE